MQTAVKKADVLVEALGWIREFRGKTTVIKLGGSLLESQDALLHILLDIVFMETVGMRPIIVHGGGAAISKAMDEAGITPRFIQGRRYTDDETLRIVKEVLARDTNHFLCDKINELGGLAEPLNYTTQNVLFGERIKLHDTDGSAIDLGHVGRVTRVDVEAINAATRSEKVVVIPSVCVEEGTSGSYLNVNADTAATAVAKAMGAEKLVYVSDVNGVRQNKDDPESRIKSLSADEARELIRNGTIVDGMIPKVEACLETLDNGVHKVHIIDGKLRHSLLLEIYTTTGVGTEIVNR
ncbi:MAG: acetylglutamate kinase [Planctomycetales bacterium]|nr:acetylglutamate kinase [Planctomycetales bacterium]